MELRYASGDLSGQSLPPLDPTKEYNFGRLTTNDVISELASVSRAHAKIYYCKDNGWVLTDKGSASGTFVHPKTFISAKAGGSNSMPVMLRDGMTLRAYTFALKFNL